MGLASSKQEEDEKTFLKLVSTHMMENKETAGTSSLLLSSSHSDPSHCCKWFWEVTNRSQIIFLEIWIILIIEVRESRTKMYENHDLSRKLFSNEKSRRNHAKWKTIVFGWWASVKGPFYCSFYIFFPVFSSFNYSSHSILFCTSFRCTESNNFLLSRSYGPGLVQRALHVWYHMIS